MNFNVLKGCSVICIYFITIIWVLLKLCACIFIGISISNFIGFTGWGWCLSSIFFICLSVRLIFSNYTVEKYNQLIEIFDKEEEF